MKSTDNQRGIPLKPHRQSGDAARLGNVARVRHGEGSRSSGQRSRRYPAAHSRERTRLLLIWSCVLGLVAVVVIGMAISFWLRPRLQAPTAEILENAPRRDDQVRVASKFPSPSREAALEVVRRALEVRDPRLLGRYFRAGAASEAEILDFLTGMEQRDGPIERFEWLSSMDLDAMLIEGVLVVFKGRDKPVERIAYLTPDSEGRWKMDFDAFARIARPSWRELMENGAQQAAVVRVMVGDDVYYNGLFRDETQWVCYAIASPDTDEILRGYCKVGSKQAEAMAQLFSEGQKMSRATLEIRRVKDAEPRQFEITRLMSKDWILTGPSSDPS